MKPRYLYALAASLAASTVALAQLPPMPSPDPHAVSSGDYAVEPLHTRVIFAVSHIAFNDYFGQFTDISGTLHLDPKNPASSKLTIAIPTASVTTTNDKLDGELKSADWFDATKFPQIKFVSTRITPTGDRTAKVAGDLTFHGVTKPVVLDATFNAAGLNFVDKKYTAGFHISGTIQRSQFGVTKFLPVVGDDVKLTISAAFEKP